MANVTLNLEFGGLCMFVKDDVNYQHSLYVVLPKFTMNLVSHCPVLVIPTTDDKAELYGLDGWSIDLSYLTQYLAKPDPRDDVEISDFSWALDVSKLTGGKLNQKWLTDYPQDKLAARLRLPLVNYTITGILPKAEIVVDGDVRNPLMPYGRVVASMTLKGFHDDVLQIGPGAVRLNGRTELRAYFVNVRRCDFSRRDPRNHGQGDEIKHPAGYYGILDGVSRRPVLTVGTQIHGHDSICLPEPCLHGRHVVDFKAPQAPVSISGGRVKPEWIDTHDCSIGTGDLSH